MNFWCVLVICFLQLCSALDLEDRFRMSVRATKEPVDGGWSEWSDWSQYGECPVNCGTGFVQSTRQRRCNNPPPSNSGLLCVGDALQTNVTVCSSDECPGNGNSVGGTIFQWSACLPVCGNGIKLRAKSACGAQNSRNCRNRKLYWQIRDCTKICRKRTKRWFSSSAGGSVSHSTNSKGDHTYGASVNTPAGSVSGSVTHDHNGHVTGGSVGVSKNVGTASVGANAGYSKDSGFSAGVSAGVSVGGISVSGGVSYNSGDHSVSFSGSAEAGGLSTGVEYNTHSGLSTNVGTKHENTGRKRREKRAEVLLDVICEESGETLFAHPAKCNVYIACHGGVAYLEICPEGQSWNNNAKRCDGSTSSCPV